MERPNIFTYATSELSQDAFILWLLQWANPEYFNDDEALCGAAQDFVRLLLGQRELEVISVECKKQENYIDVFAIVNDKYALIIEDKTNTSEHGNQLQRYSGWVLKEYPNLELHCIYYKTGNESLFRQKRLAESYKTKYPSVYFNIVNRKDVLKVLLSCASRNAILCDYVNYVHQIEENTESFRIKEIRDWNWRNWQGFYLELEKQLHAGDWGYVANPSGGFWGFWWYWKRIASRPSTELYLQFEQDKLCIKMYDEEGGKDGITYSNKVKKIAHEKNIPIAKSKKRRRGKTMTLAVVELKSFKTLDMPILIEELHEIERFVDELSIIL